MDRQDIDALLIGALYGELTPADEARLTTHLESHPTDRGALDDLKVARQAVVDSRIFAVQLDPPQHISALLLQEAHRRAPKRVAAPDDARDSWFARFTRNFMAHPAMAAAAMLVLVMGGAGIMYMKKGDQQFAAREAGQSSKQSLDDTVAVTQPVGAAFGSAAVAEGSAYKADLYEAQGKDQARAELALDEGNAAAPQSASDRWQGQQDRKSAERSRDDLSKQKAPSRAIEVTTDRAPKDFDDAKSKNDDDSAAVATGGKAAPKPGKSAATKSSGGGEALDYGGGDGTANAVSGAGAARSPADSNAGYAQPPPPNNVGASKGAVAAGPTTGTATATTTPTAPKTSDKAPAQKVATKSPPSPPPAPAEKPSVTAAAPKAEPAPAKEAKKDERTHESSLIAWAKGEHARAVTLAKNGDCAGAAKVALSVSSRASTYY